MKDISKVPAARDLITLISSSILGGKNIGESPVWKGAKVFNSVLLFGVSRGLASQFT